MDSCHVIESLQTFGHPVDSLEIRYSPRVSSRESRIVIPIQVQLLRFFYIFYNLFLNQLEWLKEPFYSR